MTDHVSDPAGGLVSRQAEVLAFERSWWSHAGGKDDAIRDRFGVTTADYYVALAEIIDDPDALEHDPLLVRRLRRQRATRRRARSARRLGDG
ncbi:DUF3263 domain-containing protein [Nocardioides sp. CER19]|uniref:DUF3263 domain-containing protein n=1 Tax=Nocardioides sp. CER19 TaxID=3038538 RepID=UPI0024478FAC|nr:DUF3263 domain-containing protein [Nocardioides sp. CER19]MDH2415822.1 DUF3263 domain-containing protein [Nocardioides sp. CER19]